MYVLNTIQLLLLFGILIVIRFYQIIYAMGPWYVIYFGVLIFCGPFYLVNLVLAVVAASYESEVQASKLVSFSQSHDQIGAHENSLSLLLLMISNSPGLTLTFSSIGNRGRTSRAEANQFDIFGPSVKYNEYCIWTERRVTS